jgi:hypothetical protein
MSSAARPIQGTAARRRAASPAHASNLILHTLGLGEAPQQGQPTSLEITQRVEARCR